MCRCRAMGICNHQVRNLWICWEWIYPLGDAGCRERPFYGLSMMQCTPSTSQGNLFVKGFNLQLQTTGLGCLRQMETKVCFSSVCTLNKLAPVLPPSTWARLIFCTEVQTPTFTLSRPLYMTSVWMKTHIKLNPSVFLLYAGHGICRVQTL